ATPAAPAAFDLAAWRAPADAEIPAGPLGASVRRGLALVRDTPDSLPAYAPGQIACTNCHLDGGRAPGTAPMAGAFARYPKHMARSGAVVGLADRVNYCFTRSLAGRPLPHASREMEDILAYLAWLSRGVPVGEGHRLPGADGQPPIPDGAALAQSLPGDSARGAAVYAAQCASCHGADGAGRVYETGGRVPALWGARSYAVGASMARQERAAAFIWHNMPLGRPRSLTPEQAYDVAAYVNAHPRPDSPGKADDWPAGGAPKDVPYALASGHAAFRAAPVLPRARARETIVPVPARAP
ncbi:c-type cytochrome, partial [Roseisolibacter sp. H3M3-2]|uniref:c-type cytochrome n=1 Tax=Roseisolibacter sp. H3M3-2 TaxID=3031323 RepID=UPI0023DB297B